MSDRKQNTCVYTPYVVSNYRDQMRMRWSAVSFDSIADQLMSAKIARSSVI